MCLILCWVFSDPALSPMQSLKLLTGVVVVMWCVMALCASWQSATFMVCQPSIRSSSVIVWRGNTRVS